MNIFIDNHHPSLTYSLELLFGKRLGHRVITPIGFDWYEQGYFRCFSRYETVPTYLDPGRADAAVHQKTEVLTAKGFEAVDAGLCYCVDPARDVYERAITFERFLDTPVDVLIASVPEHVTPFNELIRKYKPRAKLIFQMGNMFSWFDFAGVRNVLNSTDRAVPEQIHAVSYSQEFDLNVFRYTKPVFSKKIMEFVNYADDFEQTPGFRRQVMEYLEGFTLESYGSGNSAGVLTKTADVAAKMAECDFVWHLKKEGDGYGHVLHNAAACGRPVILSKKTYGALRFGRFIADGQTCIDADGLGPKELARKILQHGVPAKLRAMSQSIRERFETLVDFDGDARRVDLFLKQLR